MIELKKKIGDETDPIIQKEIRLLEDPSLKRGFDVNNIISPGNKDYDLLVKAQNAKLKRDTAEAMKAKYENVKCFTLEEIVKECVKFDLLFFESSRFKGKLSAEFGKKVDNFCTENKLAVSDDIYRTKIYFLTPSDIFKRDTEHAFEVGSVNYSRNKYSNKSENPLAFFLIEVQGESFYILIDDDKSYKTLLNRFKGYFYYMKDNARTALFSGVFILISLLFNLFFFDISVISKTIFAVNCGLSLLIAFVLTGGILYSVDHKSYDENIINKEYYRNHFKSSPKFPFESLVLLAFTFFVVIMMNNLIFNVKLRSNGNLYETTSTERTVYEKELNEKGFQYVVGKDNFIKTDYKVVYSAGYLFPKVTKDTISSTILNK